MQGAFPSTLAAGFTGLLGIDSFPVNRFPKHPKLRPLTVTALVTIALMSAARGNPVSIGDPGIVNAIIYFVAAFALAVEVALTGFLACWIYEIEDRRRFFSVLAAINVVTYSVFILGLHRFVKRVWLTEGMIWVTESIALFFLIAAMRGKPPQMKHAFALALFGNLVSFAIGWIG